MKTIIFPALLITTLLFSSFLSTAIAVEGSSQNAVLLDIGKVFKAHTRFNQGMEAMEREVEIFRGQVEQEQARIQTLAEQLRGMKQDDPQARELEASLTKMTADLQVQHQLKNNDFIKREAKLYYATYVDISQKVSKFCDQNGVSLVLRFSSEPVDSKSRESILETVNNPVVYSTKGRDVTEFIVRMVNAPTAQQATGQTIQSR